MEVFWSTSTLRSRKSSSFEESDSQFRQRVSFVSVPWKISCTHVFTSLGGGCGGGRGDEEEEDFFEAIES